jgi:hypothetical protein
MLTLPMPWLEARVDGHWTSNVTLVASVCIDCDVHPPSAPASPESAASVRPPPLVPELLPVPLLLVPLLLVPLLLVPLLLVPLLLVPLLEPPPSSSGTTLLPELLLQRAALPTRKAPATNCETTSRP